MLGVLFGALILRAALALGAWFSTADSVVFAPDTPSYLAPAYELVRRGAFATNGEPEVIRTPGYSLLLIPGVLVGRVQSVTTTLQILLALLTAIGVHALANTFTDRPSAGVAAATMFAVDLASIVYTVYLLTETLAATLLVWAAWLLVLYMRSERLSQLAGAMVLLAAGAYVRPVGLYLPACVIAFFTLRAFMLRQRRIFAHAVAAALIAVALIVPWLLRNRAAGYRGFAAVSALSLYYFSAAQVLAEKNGVPYGQQAMQMGWAGGTEWVNEERYLQQHPEQRTWSRARRNESMQEEGARIIRENLGQYARIHARGMLGILLATGGSELRTLTGQLPPPESFSQRLRARRSDIFDIIYVVAGLYLLFVYACAAYALMRRRRDAALLLVVCIVIYFIAVTGAIGESRFRVPPMPLICALAGAGLTTWLRRQPQRHHGAAALARR